MENDLSKQAKELENSLREQLGIFNKDTGSWVRIGGAVVAGGVLSYGLTRLIRGKKKNQSEEILKILQKEGLIDKNILNKSAKKKSSFMGTLGKRLFFVLLALGKAKLIEELSRRAIANGKK